MTLGRGEPIRVGRVGGRQAGGRAATVAALDEHQGIAEAVEAELKVRGWSAARLAFASDLYAGVPRRVWGYDCCAWCGREGHGIGHAMLAAACPVRSRIAARARAAALAAIEAEARERYEAALVAGLSDYEAREEGWPSEPAANDEDEDLNPVGSCVEGVPCPPFEEVRLETLP